MPSDAPKYAEPMVVKNHDTSDTHNMIVGVAAGIARAPTPLPAKQLLLLCLTVFCEPLNILTPFPFVVFMVESFGIDEDSVGLYVGLLSASFAAAQTITSIPWGWVSDRFGRRPALLCGIFGTSTAILCFGFSQNYAWAMAARASAGLLSGNIGVAKSALSELTDSTNSARAFSVFGLMFGLGGICGSLLGGFLSNPAANYPSVFGGVEFFIKFPYCLPCIVCAIIGYSGFTIGFLYFEETAPHIIAEKRKRLERESESLLQASNPTASLAPATPEPPPIRKIGMLEAINDRSVVTSIGAYSLTAFTGIMHDELYVIWAVSDLARGGLSFSSQDVGLTLTCAGAFLVVSQLIIFPQIARFASPVTIWRVASLCMTPVVAMFPLLTLVAREDLTVLVWILLLTLMASRVVVMQCLFTPSIIIVNNSADPTSVGAVNGVAQMSSSASRTAGPFLAGALWSWANKGFPFDYHFVFFLGGFMGIVMFAWSWLLPPTLAKKKSELMAEERERERLARERAAASSSIDEEAH